MAVIKIAFVNGDVNFDKLVHETSYGGFPKTGTKNNSQSNQAIIIGLHGTVAKLMFSCKPRYHDPDLVKSFRLVKINNTAVYFPFNAHQNRCE